MTEDVAEWMESYLVGRQQSIDINGTPSDNIQLNYGFPQGSSIGPFGFKLYTKPLTSIAQKHNIQIHLYADDTQLYLPFDPCDSESAMTRMEACIEEIRLWMTENFLKLNDSKTEFIMFGTSNDLAKVTEWTVSVGSSEVMPSTSVRNIGAMLDSALTMNSHINSIIRSCYFQLRSLAKIRKYLTIEAAKTLTHAFVSSRLDNMNSLLYKTPDSMIKKLQLIQNNAARVVMKQKKSCHITPILIDLHWLPVQCRIEYKLLLLVFKCLHGKGPAYLSSLLVEYRPSRSLRSASQDLLHEPAVRKRYGERAFSAAAPRLWNSLPLSVRQCQSVYSFKAALKTHLFKQGYNL